MQKSICLLANRFELKDGESFDSLRELLASKPQSSKPLNLVDKNRYLKYVWEGKGMLNFTHEDIYQIDAISLWEKENNLVLDFFKQEVFLDNEKEIELVTDSIKLIFVLDPMAKYGLLFFKLDLKFYVENPLSKLSEQKTFRYFKGPGGKTSEDFKIYNGNDSIGRFSLFSFFSNLVPDLLGKIQFPNPKFIQFHYFESACYSLDENRESYCYNILRIPASKNLKVESRYFETNPNHVFENSSVYGFAMGEGTILMSPYKSPKELVANFFVSQLLALIQKERAMGIVSLQAVNLKSGYLGQIPKCGLDELRNFRKLISVTKFYNSMPVSQYTEIQDLFVHFKKNFFSGSQFDDFNTALNEITTIIQEEADKESSERERNIGMILGILSITGFISFLFDYLFISSNERLLDYLGFPLNLIPFILFLVTFYIFWKLFNRL